MPASGQAERKMKLSPAQLEVLRLMADGWELGSSVSSQRSSTWLQKGGCGRGGESQTVSANTIAALWNRDLIEFGERSFPTQTYKLTALGEAHARPTR